MASTNAGLAISAQGDASNVTTASGSASFSLISLRRSSPLHSPTRTLRLTEAEYSLREPTPVRLSMESLATRPRSNPRSRTPMRNESPLDPNELRRRRDPHYQADNTQNQEIRRITVRPLAGSTVGINALTQHFEDRSLTSRSMKQGPSHRKMRRWNNDNFVGLAAELDRGCQAAEVLAKAQKDAHLYRAIYDPNQNPSRSIQRFMEETKYQQLRDKFFDGELPSPVIRVGPCLPKTTPVTTAEDRLNRIDARLRHLLMRAGRNSQPACKVLSLLEHFIVANFGSIKVSDDYCIESEWWQGILLDSPTITYQNGSDCVVGQFYFDAESSTGGFHRLLLHGLCQFHGLSAASSISSISIGQKDQARALRVNGSIGLPSFRLLDLMELINL